MIVDKFVSLENGDSIVGVDINTGYFQIGYKIFEDEEKIKDKFMSCDLLNSSSCQHLRDTRGPFNVVYCGSVFHLLDKEQTQTLAKSIFNLMESGGTLFGRTIGTFSQDPSEEDKGKFKYLHSENSLKELFESVGFVSVKVIRGEYEPVRIILSFSCIKP